MTWHVKQNEPYDQLKEGRDDAKHMILMAFLCLLCGLWFVLLVVGGVILLSQVL